MANMAAAYTACLYAHHISQDGFYFIQSNGFGEDRIKSGLHCQVPMPCVGVAGDGEDLYIRASRVSREVRINGTTIQVPV
jgi:hypothetical protein